MGELRTRWLAAVLLLVASCAAPQTEGPSPPTKQGSPRRPDPPAAPPAPSAPPASEKDALRDEADTTGPLTIIAVDIGQGDASIVLGPPVEGRRKALVIDAGDRVPDGGAIVEQLLVNLGVKKLDYVVLSHFDGDHLGGFVTISGSTSLLWKTDSCDPKPFFPTTFIVDQGLDDNQTKGSAEWAKCVQALAGSPRAKHLKVQGGREIGRELDLGGGYKAVIAAGDGYVLDSSTQVANVDTPNERSIAVWVTGKEGFDALITGDLIGQKHGDEDAAVEAALAQALKKRRVDIEVLRTGHHGAENASELSFLRAIKPEVAIISTGDNQKPNYKHPGCKTYEALRDAEVGLVLQTERGKTNCSGALPLKPVVVDGSIRIDVTGATYAISSIGPESANGKPTASISYACSADTDCKPGGAGPTSSRPDPGPVGGDGRDGSCCKVCANSQPCGDACIPRGRTCSKPPGCACEGHP